MKSLRVRGRYDAVGIPMVINAIVLDAIVGIKAFGEQQAEVFENGVGVVNSAQGVSDSVQFTAGELYADVFGKAGAHAKYGIMQVDLFRVFGNIEWQDKHDS